MSCIFTLQCTVPHLLGAVGLDLDVRVADVLALVHLVLAAGVHLLHHALVLNVVNVPRGRPVEKNVDIKT